MKKDLIDTIMEKEFHALTDKERAELAAFCSSEDEYNQMKDVFIGVEQMAISHPQPKAETKERLDELFDATYPKAAPIWYSSVLTVVTPKGKPVYRQPLAQIAAIALLALLLVPFWSSNFGKVEDVPEQVVQAKPVETSVQSESNVADVSVKEIVEQEPVEAKRAEVKPTLDSVFIASSVDPSGSGRNVGTLFFTAPPDVADTEHPDGVFVAISQPASDTPEMFDLLTATF